jgi:hypothetical protein
MLFARPGNEIKAALLPGGQVVPDCNLVPRCSFRWLHKPLETAEPNYFSRVQTRGFVYTLRMNILTCAQLNLDDSKIKQVTLTSTKYTCDTGQI